MDTNEVVYREEAYVIVGAAMAVYNELGCGFLESVYAEALAREFADRSIAFKREVALEVLYKSVPLGKTFRADFLVFNKILIELKAINSIGPIEKAQMLNYLKATHCKLGLILNFGAHGKLETMRLVH